MQAGKNRGFMYFTDKEKGNVPRSKTPAFKWKEEWKRI